MIRPFFLALLLLPLQIRCMFETNINSIKNNLLHFFNKDQELRAKALELDSEKNESSRQEIFNYLGIDAHNEQHCIYLKGVIDLYGWPSISQFGQEACHHAWILVQHCLDKHFQKQCLKKMKNLNSKEVEQKFIAFLHDRIKVNNGELQRYGTQCNTNGEILPCEKKGIKKIDKLRASMGLEPLNEYQEKCKKLYGKYDKQF